MKLNLIKDCNNKLTIVNINNIQYVFSYNSLIGIIYRNTLFLDDYYKNYSNTTDKHIHEIRSYYCSYSINLNSNLFDNIKDNNFNEISLNKIIDINNKDIKIFNYIDLLQYRINNKEIEIKDGVIKALKKDLKLNFNKNLLEINKEIEILKTVKKVTFFYEISNISFKIILTYNLKSKKLTNIKLFNLKRNNIK